MNIPWEELAKNYPSVLQNEIKRMKESIAIMENALSRKDETYLCGWGERCTCGPASICPTCAKNEISIVAQGIKNHVTTLYLEDSEKLSDAIMEYVKPYLRTTTPVSVSLQKCRSAALCSVQSEGSATAIAKAVLDAAGVPYVD